MAASLCRYTIVKNGPRRLFVPNSAFLTREFMVGQLRMALCQCQDVRPLYVPCRLQWHVPTAPPMLSLTLDGAPDLDSRLP